METSHHKHWRVANTALLLVPLVSMAGGLQAVEPATGSLDSRLENRVRQHIQEGFQKSAMEAEIIAVQLPRMIVEFPSASSIRMVRDFVPTRAAGHFAVPVELKPPGGKPVRLTASVECVAVVHAWAARLPLQRGSDLKLEDFERKTIRIMGREEQYYTAEDFPDEYSLSTSLTAGQILQFHHLEPKPVIRQGDQVTIQLTRESITLISPGQARRDGRIGDLIPVIVGVSGKRLMGRLVAPGIVVVE